MRAAPLIPPAPDKAPPPAAELSLAPLSSAPAPAPTAALPTAAPGAMDKEFILRNQIPERYIAGRLPIRGAQDFERYCAAHPELIDELGLAERVHSGLRLLEAGGVSPPWEARPKRWWEKPATPIAALVLAIAGLVAALVMGGKLSGRDTTIANLHAQMRLQPIDPATSTHNVRLVPSRTAPSSRDAVVLGGAAEMGDLRIDMSWSQFQVYRVTIDRVDQGRVAVLHNLLRDSNGDLHLALNTSAFGPGSYQFTIEGMTLHSEAVPQAWVTVGIAH